MKTKQPFGERIAEGWRAIVDYLNPEPIEGLPEEGDHEDE